MTKHDTVTSSPKPTDPVVAGGLRPAADPNADTLDVLRRIVDVADEARQRGGVVAERAKALVATRPLTAVAGAFAAGYLAMLITTSKLTQLAVLGGLLYVTGGVLRKRSTARA